MYRYNEGSTLIFTKKNVQIHNNDAFAYLKRKFSSYIPNNKKKN